MFTVKWRLLQTVQLLPFSLSLCLSWAAAMCTRQRQRKDKHQILQLAFQVSSRVRLLYQNVQREMVNYNDKF